MFSKLLKYDYRATKKLGKPLFFIVLGLIGAGMVNSVLLGLSTARMGMMLSMSELESDMLVFFTMMSSMLMVMIMLALGVAVLLIMIWSFVHFYKSLTTDEGYLTFTLPVRSTDILNAKLVNAVAWIATFMLLSVLGILLIVGTLSVSTAAFGEKGLATGMKQMLETVASANALAILQGTIVTFATIVNTVMLYNMVIFFSSVVSKKNRVVTAIGCIVGTYFAYGMINNIIMIIVALVSAAIDTIFTISYMDLILILYLLMLIGSSVLFYFGTKRMMEKKLNLP